MEFGRQRLEVAVLSKPILRFIECALGFGLQQHLGWTKRVLLRYELMPIVRL